MLVKFEELGKKPDPGMPLLQLGFRPFFLLAGVSAVLLILIWSLLFSAVGPDTVYGTVYWHGHEMVFGYVMAVVAGFLLTAVKRYSTTSAFYIVVSCPSITIFPGIHPLLAGRNNRPVVSTCSCCSYFAFAIENKELP